MWGDQVVNSKASKMDWCCCRECRTDPRFYKSEAKGSTSRCSGDCKRREKENAKVRRVLTYRTVQKTLGLATCSGTSVGNNNYEDEALIAKHT